MSDDLDTEIGDAIDAARSGGGGRKKPREDRSLTDLNAELFELGAKVFEAQKRAQEVVKQRDEKLLAGAEGLRLLGIDPGAAGLPASAGRIKPRPDDIEADDDATKELPAGTRKKYTDDQLVEFYRENDGKYPEDAGISPEQLNSISSRIREFEQRRGKRRFRF